MTVSIVVSTTLGADNYYRIHHAGDTTTNVFGVDGLNNPVAVDTDITFQGTGSNRHRHQNTGEAGGTMGVIPNRDYRNTHLLTAVKVLDATDLFANAGWRLRLAENNEILSDYIGWTTSGRDKELAIYNGFFFNCANTDRPPDQSVGVVPQLTAIGIVGTHGDFPVVSTRETWFTEVSAFIRGFLVAGGTAGAPGNSDEIASDDRSSGRGLFKSAQGIMFVLGNVWFGDDANANSEFQDNNKTWVFEDFPVAGGFHGLRFAAGTGTNNAFFGIKSGTGVDEDGSGGNVFIAAGEAPFHITADDANINTGFYGCVFTNAPAPMWDAARSVQIDDGGAFTDETQDAADAGAADFNFFPAAEVIGDAFVIGADERFQKIEVTVSTAGVAGVVAWEYWDGAAWSALPWVLDNTDDFKRSGLNEVDFEIPADWARQTINNRGSYYYIRARVTTVYSTNPVGTQVRIQFSGTTNLKVAQAEIIRATMTNQGSIDVEGGGILKKVVNVNSKVRGGNAAIHLGAADPAADTVRDLTIQNAPKGLLVSGTATGTTDFNLRNIQLSGCNRVSAMWQFDSSAAAGSQYIDQTDVINAGTTVNLFHPGFGVLDAHFVGSETPFTEINYTIVQAGVGSYTIGWEYWNGTSWQAVTGLVDGTGSFKNAPGDYTVSFNMPTDWLSREEGDASDPPRRAYYVKAFISVAGMTTVPTANRVEVPGDVRVNFPAAATINLNILEGSTVPQVDNVNGSTVNVNASVPISVTVTADGVPVQGAVVYLETVTAVVVLNGVTDAQGVITGSFSGTTPVNIDANVSGVKDGSRATPYQYFPLGGQITSSGYSQTALLTED